MQPPGNTTCVTYRMRRQEDKGYSPMTWTSLKERQNTSVKAASALEAVSDPASLRLRAISFSILWGLDRTHRICSEDGSPEAMLVSTQK